MTNFQYVNSSSEKEIKENTIKYLEGFEKIVETKNIDNIKHVIKFMANTIQGLLNVWVYYNNRNKDFNLSIRKSLMLDKINSDYKPCKYTCDIKSTPIISCVWNYERVIDNIIHIGICNEKPFKGIDNSNVCGLIIEPIGLIVITDGNHSINSAIIHNEGQVQIDKCYDLSDLFVKYRFDGIDFQDIETNNRINIGYLVNDSKPLFYELGLIFEMGKILNKYDINLMNGLDKSAE